MRLNPPPFSTLTSPIVTLIVGHEQRLFAAHEEVLCHSPFFATMLKGQFLDAGAKKVELPDESVFNMRAYSVTDVSQGARDTLLHSRISLQG